MTDWLKEVENKSMSDLLIKGAIMPQGCRQCHFKEWTNSRAGWFCPLRHKFLSMRVIIQAKRYADCPLVAIPSHGRLIDADKVIKKMEKIATEAWQIKLSDTVEHTLNMSMDILNHAPTVIEKEK